MVVAKNNKELRHLISEVKNGKLKLDEIDVSEVRDFSEVFVGFTFDPKYGSIEDWDVSNGVNFMAMFKNAKGISLLNLSKWRLSSAENCSFMFVRCKDFIGGDLSNWNPTNLKFASNMFSGCENFIGRGLDKWHLPNLMYSDEMFAECTNFDQDLSNWDCRNLKNLYGMFEGCTKFRGVGLEKWNIAIKSDGSLEKVSVLNDVFKNCINFDADLSSWKVEGPFYLKYTFKNCKNFKGKGLEKWEITVLRDEGNRYLEYTFNECLKLDFTKNLKWEFKLPETSSSSHLPTYYSTFVDNVSLTTTKFLNPNIIIYQPLLSHYDEIKSPSKRTFGFYSVEELPDNITFYTHEKWIKNNLKLWQSFPNLKRLTPINIRTYKEDLSKFFNPSTPEDLIETLNFKIASRRIQLKRAKPETTSAYIISTYNKKKMLIPLNVKYASGSYGYPLAKKTEVILPHISYYKLIQKIPVYENGKMQVPNAVLAETQEKFFSEKLFFNSKNVFFNKDYIKCF